MLWCTCYCRLVSFQMKFPLHVGEYTVNCSRKGTYHYSCHMQKYVIKLMPLYLNFLSQVFSVSASFILFPTNLVKWIYFKEMKNHPTSSMMLPVEYIVLSSAENRYFWSFTYDLWHQVLLSQFFLWHYHL